jgi:GxxExxY protein
MSQADLERLAKTAIDCGFQVHGDIGPGLLETAYEAFLAAGLVERGLHVEVQKPVPVTYRGIVIRDAFRADLLVEQRLVIEIKSVERLAPVHAKQLLTYLRLMDQPLGLLMNFGAEMFRNGLKRVINNRSDFAGRYTSSSSPPTGG